MNVAAAAMGMDQLGIRSCLSTEVILCSGKAVAMAL
jgi:hypothetical protein